MSDQQVVRGHIECGGEGVQIGVHEDLQVRVG
jgi:hypothetical protein